MSKRNKLNQQEEEKGTHGPKEGSGSHQRQLTESLTSAFYFYHNSFLSLCGLPTRQWKA